jgi:hypothetical protein
MQEINLHVTGDVHAVSAANNLLAALIDNHLYGGNALGLDPRRISWRRALDMNDRALRQLVVGLGGMVAGYPREDGFDIAVASEVMAMLSLARDLANLKARLGRMIVGHRRDRSAVTAADLTADDAMAVLLRDALNPNLMQTLEGTPAFVHGGPFANIAHGCTSVIATRTALAHADVVVTVAGFGADLGAEKFLHIKCRQAGLAPDCVVRQDCAAPLPHRAVRLVQPHPRHRPLHWPERARQWPHATVPVTRRANPAHCERVSAPKPAPAQPTPRSARGSGHGCLSRWARPRLARQPGRTTPLLQCCSSLWRGLRPAQRPDSQLRIARDDAAPHVPPPPRRHQSSSFSGAYLARS